MFRTIRPLALSVALFACTTVAALASAPITNLDRPFIWGAHSPTALLVAANVDKGIFFDQSAFGPTDDELFGGTVAYAMPADPPRTTKDRDAIDAELFALDDTVNDIDHRVNDVMLTAAWPEEVIILKAPGGIVTDPFDSQTVWNDGGVAPVEIATKLIIPTLQTVARGDPFPDLYVGAASEVVRA